MRTDIIPFVLGSENRKQIVRTIFEYPQRQWSCSALEELAKKSHATVFRTLNDLRAFGILKSTKINKKDILYELVKDSPFVQELKRLLSLDKTMANKIARTFVNKIKSKKLYSAMLYGSAVTEKLRPNSDIDILLILDKHNGLSERRIFDVAAELSSKVNRTISATIMGRAELNKEKNSQFISSVKENSEVLYGKEPFSAG